MKKLLSLVLLAAMASPVLAISSVDETTAQVKLGPVKVKIDNSKENQNASISRAGDNVVTFGCTYSKTKIKGIKTSSTTALMVLQFDSLEGDFEAGQTYDLSHSNGSVLTTIITATQLKNLKTKGIVSSHEKMGEEIPIATGKFKVKAYDPTTKEITGILNAQVSPMVALRGNKVKLVNKPQKIKMKINTIVQ